MEKFKAGDLITYRLHGDDFGLAQVLLVQDLALHDYYHLALLDAILEGEDQGVDSYGVSYERRHTLDGAELAPVVIDHMALTVEAFSESDPAKVGERPVKASDLLGYRVWMMNMRESMVRRGLLPPDEEGDDDDRDDGDEEELDELEEIDEIAEEVDEDDLKVNIAGDEVLEDDDEGEDDDDDEDEDEDNDNDDNDDNDDTTEITLELRQWHEAIYSEPLHGLLFRIHDEFRRPALQSTKLGAYICSFFDESNMDDINEMVRRFVEGDYSAGHELTAFGDVAINALAQHLQEGMEPQLADDILNILCDSGSLPAYEHIATFFAQHESADDPLALPAARGYCYAVMLTGGTPPPLREHLARLDDIPFDELEHDITAAKDAVANLGEVEEE